MATYEPVIGIEVHLQLKTASKMYCSCKNQDNPEPNRNICPICMGHPGTLPVVNSKAVELIGKLSLAVQAEIRQESVFARKNYFYPDLPKGYQISQYELPFALQGKIDIETKDLQKKTIHIERLHLEEDAAKMIHTPSGSSLVDFNRAGAPLVEVVSQAEIGSAEEARLYLEQLQAIARVVGASDADMEKGQMRCDVNISVRPHGDSTLYTKVEIKNLNSIRAAEQAIVFETQRQSALWEAGHPQEKIETRGWNDQLGETVHQRYKEQEADYRYFAEPDIPPLRVTEQQVIKWRAEVPELPAQRQVRFMEEYELSKHDAGVLVGGQRVADFFEATVSELRAWVNSLESTQGSEDEIWTVNRKKLVRLTFGWLTSDLFKLLNERGLRFQDVRITEENFAELLSLVFEHKVNRTAAAQVLAEMLRQQDVPNGSDPSPIIERLGLQQENNVTTLGQAVDAVIASQPQAVADVKSGKQKAMMMLIGQVMKQTKGTANPETVAELLKQKLT